VTRRVTQRRGNAQGIVYMFGPPGHAYVYLIYATLLRQRGLHAGGSLPKRVTDPLQSKPDLERRFGLEQRSVAARNQLTNGPAKLCQAMAIDLGVGWCRPLRHQLPAV